MIFQKTITTPFNTPIASPKKTILPVVYGAIYKMEIQFRFGSVLLMGVRIFDNTYQIYPATLGEWFLGHGILISFEDRYMKKVEPFEFEIETYNLDDTYDHQCIVRIGMAVTRDEINSLYPSLMFEEMNRSIVVATEQEQTGRRSIFQRAVSFLKKIGE